MVKLNELVQEKSVLKRIESRGSTGIQSMANTIDDESVNDEIQNEIAHHKVR
jgi:hypothetical protein